MEAVLLRPGYAVGVGFQSKLESAVAAVNIQGAHVAFRCHIAVLAAGSILGRSAVEPMLVYTACLVDHIPNLLRVGAEITGVLTHLCGIRVSFSKEAKQEATTTATGIQAVIHHLLNSQHSTFCSPTVAL